MRLSLKLLLPILAFAALVAAIIGAHVALGHGDVRERSAQEMAAKAAAARAGVLDRLAQAAAVARLVAWTPGLQDAIDARDRDVPGDLPTVPTGALLQFGRIDVLTVYGPDDAVLARGDTPAGSGRPDALAPWLAELRRDPARQPWTAARPDGDRILLAAAEPVATLDRNRAAIVVAGFVVDADFLAGLKLRSGADIEASLDGRPMASTLPAARPDDPALTAAAVPLADAIPALGGFALTVLADDSAQRERFRSRLTLVLAMLGAAGLAVLTGATLLTIRAVTGPLAALTRSLTDLAAGRMNAAIPHLTRRDGIGAMARAAEAFKRSMVETVEAVERTARRERERAAMEQAEAEARSSAAIGAQMQQILDASPVPLLLLRGDPAVIARANRAALDLLEIDPSGLGTLAPPEVAIGPAERVRLSAIKAGAGALDALEARVLSRGGREIRCSLAGRFISHDGTPALLLGLLLRRRRHRRYQNRAGPVSRWTKSLRQ